MTKAEEKAVVERMLKDPYWPHIRRIALAGNEPNVEPPEVFRAQVFGHVFEERAVEGSDINEIRATIRSRIELQYEIQN